MLKQVLMDLQNEAFMWIVAGITLALCLEASGVSDWLRWGGL